MCLLTVRPDEATTSDGLCSLNWGQSPSTAIHTLYKAQRRLRELLVLSPSRSHESCLAQAGWSKLVLRWSLVLDGRGLATSDKIGDVHGLFLREDRMLVRFLKIAEGPGPSEMLVGVLTVNGLREEVVISKRQAEDGRIDVGSPLIEEGDRCLVELPRESMSGRWRLWVPRSEVDSSVVAQAAE